MESYSPLEPAQTTVQRLAALEKRLRAVESAVARLSTPDAP